MKVSEFEKAVFEIDGVHIVVRANANEEVQEYSYNNRADSSWSINEWLDKRIYKHTGDFEIVVLNGNYTDAHRGIKLENLRSDY